MEPTGQLEPIRIEALAEGAIVEMLELALQEVWRNICDPNTKAETKRTAKLVIEAQADSERDVVHLSFRAETKLAPPIPVPTKIALARLPGGEVVACELPSRQMTLPIAGVTELKR